MVLTIEYLMMFGDQTRSVFHGIFQHDLVSGSEFLVGSGLGSQKSLQIWELGYNTNLYSLK